MTSRNLGSLGSLVAALATLLSPIGIFTLAFSLAALSIVGVGVVSSTILPAKLSSHFHRYLDRTGDTLEDFRVRVDHYESEMINFAGSAVEITAPTPAIKSAA